MCLFISTAIPHFSGVEYHLPQLADVRAAAVGVPDLDDAGAPPLRHALLALHPAVRPGPVRPAVRLGHGARARAAPERGHHEPAPAGPGQVALPLPAPGSHGENQYNHASWEMKFLNTKKNTFKVEECIIIDKEKKNMIWSINNTV